MFGDHESPEGAGFPPIHALITGKPNSWQGMSIEWLSAEDPKPVLIGTLNAPGDGREPEIYLFGARYELAEALVDGQALGGGYFIEYFVVEELREGGWRVYRLLQRESVTFSESTESRDYVPAAAIGDAGELSIDHPPQWKREEAMWPTCENSPMSFLGQIELPETDLTRTFLTWGVTLYVFWSHVRASDCYKIVQQETELQTAQEHYENESE